MAEIDTRLYSGNVAPDPIKKMQEVTALAQQLQALDLSKHELALKQLNALTSVTSSFLADPDAGKVDITKKVQDQATKLAGMGLYTPQMVVQFLKGFPKDPTEQYKQLQVIHARSLSASEQLDAMLGALRPTNTGTGELLTQTPRYRGLPGAERGFIKHGLPPTTTVPNPDTLQPEYTGNDQPSRLEQRPGSVQVPGQDARRPGSRLAPTPSPQPQATPAAPAPARQAETQSARPDAGSGRTPAGFSLGTPEATAAAGTQLAGEREAAASYQERVNPMRGAIEILSKMGPKAVGNIGPGSEQFNQLKSAAQTWGLGEIAGVDPNKVADFNKLRKYFEDAAARRVTAVGGPKTNDALASALMASPNAKMDRLSALELSKLNLGLDRMRQAAILDFDAQKPAIPPGQFGTWRAKWATGVDPRAFVYDLMTADAQQKLLKGMSKAQREKFEASLALAEKHGLLGDVKD